MIYGIEETYYNSPILNYINIERLNIFMVLITAENKKAGSPDHSDIREACRKNVDKQEGILFREVDVRNPIERALFDYI